jgi:hypothetical protein
MTTKSRTLRVLDAMAREKRTLAMDSQSSAILRAALARPPEKPAATAAATGSQQSPERTDK